MDEYEVVFARSARKELQSLPEPVSQRVLRKVERLSATPRPRGCRKLAGAENLWRLRVGDYRVVYAIDDVRGLVDIITIRHRGDAYR